MAALSLVDRKAIQHVIGVKEDGKLSSVQIMALQNRLAVKVDGKLGPVTYSALQSWLGVPVDGKWGPITRKAAQSSTNKLLMAPITVTDPAIRPTGPLFHVPDFTTVKFNTTHIAIAMLGLGAATLFGFAARSARA
jgi:hypothetical protein